MIDNNLTPLNNKPERQFYTAKIDAIFKTIFVQEEDHHLMEALLSNCLGEPVTVIKYLKVELDVKRSKERTKRLDVLVRANDRIINIELNTNDDNRTKIRNFNFFTAFYSSKTNRGNSYDNEIEYIQINLSFNMAKSKPIISTYKMRDEVGNTYLNNFKIIEVNMDKIKNEWYDNGKKGSRYLYLLMIDLNKKELKELITNNKDIIIGEYMERIEELNNEDVFVPPVSYEEDERLMLEGYKKEARREGLREGRAEGRVEGRAEGRAETSKEIAKNMLAKSYDINTIMEITGLSKEDINNL